MDVNGPNMEVLHTSFNAALQRGMHGRQAASQWREVAMQTQSATAEEQYAWLNQLPGMRRWVGDRTIVGLSRQGLSIVNDDYELTIAVQRNDIEDDRYGIYAARFQALGEAAEAHPDELVWPLLNAGFGDDHGLCWDGQYFFDTDHPYLDADGVQRTQANTDGGGGTKWYLMDSRMMARPLIYQVRKPIGDLVMMVDPTDDNVFRRREFLYGVDCRDAVGYGFYQTCWGSRQALDSAHYETARAAMMTMRGDGGRRLGLVPDKLVVPPALEGPARRLLENETLPNGGANEWHGTAQVVVVPWLAE